MTVEMILPKLISYKVRYIELYVHDFRVAQRYRVIGIRLSRDSRKVRPQGAILQHKGVLLFDGEIWVKCHLCTNHFRLFDTPVINIIKVRFKEDK